MPRKSETLSPIQENLFSPPPENLVTLPEARAAVRRMAEKGGECPCCDQYVKIYRRNLNSGMANVLLRVHRYFLRHPDHEWLHVSKFLAEHKIQRADEAKLCFWGLLIKQGGERKDGSKRNGFYRISEKGIEFAEGRLAVPKYVWLLNNKVLGFSNGVDYPQATVTVQDALSDQFDYREIMSWSW